MRAKQLSFLPKISKIHGGQTRVGRRKIARPIDPKRPLHLILKSSQARGEWSMLGRRNRVHVDEFARKTAEKHGIRLYRYANVGNHLHLLVKTPNRGAFKSFLRELAGGIAMIVTGARKSHANLKRFWDFPAYTRIVEWGRDFVNLELYFVKNLFEAAGVLTKKAKAAGLRVIPLFGWGVSARNNDLASFRAPA